MALSFRSAPALNLLAGNPVRFELFSDTRMPLEFDLEVDGAPVHTGVFVPLGAVAPFEADIAVQDLLQPFFAEPPVLPAPDAIVGEMERMYVDFTVSFRRDGDLLTHTARAYRGGVSKEMLRFLYEKGLDIFSYRLMNTQRQFFLTARTLGNRIVIRRDELTPLGFIATGKMHRVTADTGETFFFPPTEPGKVYAFRVEAFAASLAQRPKQLTIPLFMGYAMTVDIVDAARVPDRLLLEFANSYGVPERLEVTGRGRREPETADESINRYDFRVDDYVERNERQQRREIIIAESGYKTPDEMMFLRDLLQSDRVELIDADGARREVRVKAENFSHALWPFQPESVELSIRFAESDSRFTPRLPLDDSRLDRIFMLSFSVTAGHEQIYIPFTGNVDLLIDWGDGTEETVTADNPQHAYAAPGEYTVAAAGHADRLQQSNTSYPPFYQANWRHALTAVERWGDLGLKSLEFAFVRCSNLREIERKPLYLFKNLTSLAYAFSECISLNAVFESMDAPLLQSAAGFCAGCHSLEYIPDGLFAKCPALEYVSYAFQNCLSLVHVSEMLFAGCEELTQAAAVFSACTELRNGVTFFYNKKIQTFDQLYMNCPNLESVPDWCFADSVATSFNSVFQGCTSLASLPEHILAGAAQARNFEYFAAFAPLESLPANLFADCTLATGFRYAFRNTKIQTLPANLFQHQTDVTSFAGVFYQCDLLAGIPDGLFRNSAGVTSFEECFYGCRELTAVPADLFRYNINVTSFASCFFNCEKLTAIPADLFRYCVNVTSFYAAFANCKKVTSIPAGLLAYHANAVNLMEMFYGCSLITSIPAGLFDAIANSPSTVLDLCFARTAITAIDGNIFAHLTQITQLRYVFSHTPLAVIPAGLLAQNTEAVNVEGLFEYTDVTDIPEGLFSACTKLRYAAELFRYCVHLAAIPNLLFDANREILQFGTVFFNCTALNGASPSGSDGVKLWERAGNPGYPAAVNGEGCFHNCTGLSDYAAMPAFWTKSV